MAEESACNVQKVYRIGGISVEFPYKAYGSQLAFMGKVVATLERSHRGILPSNNRSSSISDGGRCHALLESPTGTGKSLALLCSTLAWLKHFKTAASRLQPSQPINDPVPDAMNSCAGFEGNQVPRQESATGGGFLSGAYPTGGGGFISEDTITGGGFLPEERTGGPSEGNRQTSKKHKCPTIFYATRTHSQITQVIREYRKTSYRVPMAVLAARKHYCTNKQVCKKKNIDEECKLLLKDSERSCFQFKNVHKVKNHYSLQKGGAHEIHDIEDLVGIGNSVRGCAYFAARSLAVDAEIVFCPYSYLLNPVIRNAMEINLDGSIVILDEAHNIEDVAREAGSIDLETSTLEGLRMELEQLCAMGPSADFYNPLLEMVQEMLSWIYQKSNSLEKHDFERYSSCWFGEGALQELEQAGIQLQGFEMLLECAKKAIGAAAEAEADGSHLSGFAAGTLEGLFSVLTFMLKDNGRHIHDYRLVVQKYVKRDADLGVPGWISSVSLWSLNPAVVFGDIASKAQSIILTSGTLSPIGSFSSELGVTFEVSMEAPHVIDMKTQVWAGSLPRGLGNVSLNASYKHADGYAFQDALGKTLEELFKVTPDGALVFFPSYKLLEKLCDRWKATGQWNQLYELKQLFIEPRGQMETFETMLANYYRVINGKSNISVQKGKPRGGGKKITKDHHTETFTNTKSKSGAAFLAVCRGKVSEGIDFSDKNARLVIIVGIPFPNQKDMQVNLKKQYNNQNKCLLSGDQWYCYQAFRALNQAVGRCIRHRHDYGAIILLDERYKRASNLEYMSKWLRNSIQQVETLEDSLKGLDLFFQKFKDISAEVSPSLHLTTANDLERIPGSSSKRVTKSAPAKQSQKISSIDDKENAFCQIDQAVRTVNAKKRLPKNGQSGRFSVAHEKQSALKVNGHTQRRIIDVQSARKECNQAPVLKQACSSMEETGGEAGEVSNEGPVGSDSVIILADSPAAIRVQAREDSTEGPACSRSVITLADSPSPTMTAACSSPRCLHACISFGDTSAQKHAVEAEEHRTPSISVFSNRSEVYIASLVNRSVHSHETAVSTCNNQRPVTPCNLFKEINESIGALSSKCPENFPSTDAFMTRLTTDFTACNEVILCNGSKYDVSKANGLLAGKQILDPLTEPPTTDMHVAGFPRSVFCLKCGTSLLGPLDYGNWQKVEMKKTYLDGLSTERKLQQSEPLDVLVLELPLLHPLIQDNTSNTSYLNQLSGSMWVKEDGCVFKPLFCPGCNFKQCIGAYVLAADRMNTKLVEKALILCEAVEMIREEGGCIGVSNCCENQLAVGSCEVQLLDSFVKRTHPTQTTPRAKLKLPRRD